MLNKSLVYKYEAGGNPATVSSGGGDLGGVSYGIYQFSSESGVVRDFVNWLCAYDDDKLANYGRVLKQAYPINSTAFKNKWQELGNLDPGNFGRLQDEYAGDKYYNAAYYKLLHQGFDLTKHSEAMKAVVFSRSIQYGASNMPELFLEACHRIGQPNLSYVDNKSFDKQMITSIYDFLHEECINARDNGHGFYHSPKDWANGSQTVVKIGLANRFVHEKEDALKLLEEA